MFTKLNLPVFAFRTKQAAGQTFIFDEIRKKFLALTPEEEVRQRFIRLLITEKGYPASLMVIERGLVLNGNRFRADLLLYNRAGNPLLIAEFKAPAVRVTQAAFDQVARYNMRFQVPYLIVSNGLDHYCCRIDFQAGTYFFLAEIPPFEKISG